MASDVCCICGTRTHRFNPSRPLSESRQDLKICSDCLNMLGAIRKNRAISDPCAQRLAKESTTKLRDLVKSKDVSGEVQRAIDENLGFPCLAEAESMEHALMEAGKEIQEASKRKAEEARKMREAAEGCVVTTADLHQPYDVIGPVFFQISNKGGKSSFSAYFDMYKEKIQQGRESGVINQTKDFGESLFALITPESYVGQSLFDPAFYIAVEELKVRATAAGGNAVVGMKMDFDLDTTGIGGFYLQMYGTAVRTKA